MQTDSQTKAGSARLHSPIAGTDTFSFSSPLRSLLAAVRALPKRYADVDRHVPFVASIAVTSIDAGKDRNSPK